jgi:hypothetical protein
VRRRQSTTTAGIILAAAGLLLSVAAFVHDGRRLLISRKFPQAAPSRIAPEVHAVSALIMGAGAGLIGGWATGAVIAFGCGLVSYLIVRPLIHRL